MIISNLLFLTIHDRYNQWAGRCISSRLLLEFVLSELFVYLHVYLYIPLDVGAGFYPDHHSCTCIFLRTLELGFIRIAPLLLRIDNTLVCTSNCINGLYSDRLLTCISLLTLVLYVPLMTYIWLQISLSKCYLQIINKRTQETTEGGIKNGQSRDTGNNGLRVIHIVKYGKRLVSNRGKKHLCKMEKIHGHLRYGCFHSGHPIRDGDRRSFVAVTYTMYIIRTCNSLCICRTCNSFCICSYDTYIPLKHAI